MRRILTTAIAGAVLSTSLGLATAAPAAAATNERTPQCVRVLKYFTKDHKRYAQLKNLCSRRPACYTIVVPTRPDVAGRLDAGATSNVRYGTDRDPRALYVKNRAC